MFQVDKFVLLEIIKPTFPPPTQADFLRAMLLIT